jgi:hypothetical protein
MVCPSLHPCHNNAKVKAQLAVATSFIKTNKHDKHIVTTMTQPQKRDRINDNHLHLLTHRADNRNNRQQRACDIDDRLHAQQISTPEPGKQQHDDAVNDPLQPGQLK